MRLVKLGYDIAVIGFWGLMLFGLVQWLLP